jgi:hypothetical protein
MRHPLTAALAMAVLVTCGAAPGGAPPFAATVTYQGRLDLSGQPVDGPTDMTFRLYDAPAGGTQVGASIPATVDVDGGLFTVALDFTAGETIAGVYDGYERWLEIEVESVVLAPRQRFTPAPHAMVARQFALPLAQTTTAPTIMDLTTTSSLEQVRALRVQATSDQVGAIAIFGECTDTTANTENVGVYGLSHSGNGFGVAGVNLATDGNNAAVYGITASPMGAGVFGEYPGGAGDFLGAGVYGRTAGGDGSRAIFGEATGLAGASVAIEGIVNSPLGVALRGVAASPSGYAGWFDGRSHFDGHVSVGDFPGLAITLQEEFGVHSSAVTGFGGMYISTAGAGAQPFYGYAAGQDVDAYHYFDGTSDQWRLFAGAPRLVVSRATGNVGIGTTAPAFLLHVNGSAGKPGGGSWSVASDARLKKDVQPLAGALDRLLALRGVTFEYVDPDAVGERPGRRIGMIAQEVERVFPDWVEDGPDGWKRLAPSGFEALAVEALRDLAAAQAAEVARLEMEVAAVRAEKDAALARLEDRLARLERALAEGR